MASASERLRALVDSHGWPPHGLKEAMPEIIAVVEAAEQGRGWNQLGPVLDALTSKLSGEGQ